jgi:hypothetical protein
MNFNIILTADALREEAESYLYYENQSDGLGDRFLTEIEFTLNKIASHPEHYSFCDTTKTIRDISLPNFPFVVIFELIQNGVIVFNIHHTKKNI